MPGDAAQPRRQPRCRPTFEALETRRLLSRPLPLPPRPPNVRVVTADQATYRIAIDGPGVLRVRPAARGGVGIVLYGTTEASTLNVTRIRIGPHWVDSGLPVGAIIVKSGTLGAIEAGGTADLLGPVTPLRGSVRALRFRTIGPNAQIDVGLDLGTLAAGDIDLGPNGTVHVGRALTGSISVTNALELEGGSLLVGQGPIAAITANAIRIADDGLLASGGAIGPITTTAGLTIENGGQLAAITTLDTLTVGGLLLLDAGEILVSQGPIAGVTANTILITNDGRITTGGALGPIVVATDLTLDTGGNLNAGTTLGGITTGRDLVARPTGRIDVGTNSVAPIAVGQDLLLDGGQLIIQGNLVGGLTVGRDALLTDGGQLVVVRDISGPVAIGNNLTLDTGNFTVGRDITAAATIGGDFTLANGGPVDAPLQSIFGVGRDLDGGLSIGGNLDTSRIGFVQVGGNLDGLTIAGALIGRGDFGQNAPDLSVGLDLHNLTVLGAVPNQGSITNADINIGKSLVGLDIRHGIFNSFITVGVLIDGGAPTPTAGHIGPDATYAVFDSEIRAGVQIRNLVINGDVASDIVTNPDGHATRIVAGQDRAGIISPAASIDNFQITGRLIDSVVVASVAPSGGDGSLDPNAGPTLAVGNYDAPAGYIAGGAIGAVVLFPHNSPPSYNEFGQLVGYFYDPLKTPVPDDLVMFGSINRSFAPTPLAPNPPPADGTPIPLPTRSTVLGGVIDTAPPGDAFDHAGLFAADTYGVFVGVLPRSGST